MAPMRPQSINSRSFLIIASGSSLCLDHWEEPDAVMITNSSMGYIAAPGRVSGYKTSSYDEWRKGSRSTSRCWNPRALRLLSSATLIGLDLTFRFASLAPPVRLGTSDRGNYAL